LLSLLNVGSKFYYRTILGTIAPSPTHPISALSLSNYSAKAYKAEAPRILSVGIGLHVLAAICFALHTIDSGQSLYWLILIFSLPLLGTVVYFLAIYFPEVRHSGGAQQALRPAKQLMNLGQDLGNARAELARAPTVQNRVRLSMTLLMTAKPRRPGPNSSIAQALVPTQTPETGAAFERSVECVNDSAARCLFAELLMAQPQPANRKQVRRAFASIIDEATHWSRCVLSHNGVWLERAKTAMKGI